MPGDPQQFYLRCLAHASYVIGDEATRTAIVVDPQRDTDQYITFAAVRWSRSIAGAVTLDAKPIDSSVEKADSLVEGVLSAQTNGSLLVVERFFQHVR